MDQERWSKRLRLALEGSPVVAAAVFACYGAVFIAIAGKQADKGTEWIVWNSLFWGLMFGIGGALYPRTVRFVRKYGPQKRK